MTWSSALRQFVRTAALLGWVTIATLPAQQQPTPRELFERARILEEGSRNLDEAIALYGQVVTQSADRELAADAQLRAGLLHERLGRPADAQQALTSIVTRYPDLTSVVRRAQAHLAVLVPSAHVGGSEAVARRLWAGANVSYAAAASPNGQFLTVQDMTTGGLAMREISTGRMRQVTAVKQSWNEFALTSVVSPDSRQVAYTWAVTQPHIVYELRTSPVAGGEPKVIYRNAEDSYVQPGAWTPDGGAILAAISRRDLTTQIALVSTRNTEVRVLKTLDWQSPGGLSLSPDGRWIAYAALPNREASKKDIFLLDVGGEREVVVISHAADDIGPMWTPDGRGIVFLSDRSGAVGLWFVRITDGRAIGAPQLVKPDLGRRVFPLGMSAAGSYFYAVQSGGGDIAVVPFDPVTGRPVGTPKVISERYVGTNEWPVWSPDGSSLAYLSNRGQMSPRAFVLHSMATGTERDIPLPTGYSARVPRWSPDGRSLVFVGSDDRGRPGLYVVDVRTGNLTTMVRNAPGLQVDWVDWMPGGAEVIYDARDDPAGGSRLVKRTVATGQEQELYRTDQLLRALAVSPDGA